MAGTRLDKLLVEKALVPSRERARALIMAGKVLVNDEPVTKAGAQVSPDANLRLRGEDIPFVSRGGLKLDGALDDLDVDVSEKIILDVGASTGGFTDCCLKRGAKHVYAVDVGTNQLAYSLRTDPRVTCMEKTNARHLEPSMFPSPADLAVMDVSFISSAKLLEPTLGCLRGDGSMVIMVKPQFEVGKDKVGKGGVVRDDAIREEAVEIVLDEAGRLGLTIAGRADSKIHGPKGNREIFLHLIRKEEET